MVKNSVDEIFEVGKDYTVFDINSMMAMTIKRELTITGTHDDGNPIFKMKGKRKRFIFSLRSRSYQSAPLLETKSAIFAGFGQAIKCDTEGGAGVMRGNALYNFVGSPDDIRAWIERFQLNPNFEREKVVSIASRNISDSDAPETLVYPELYKGGHAVIDRLLPA